MNCSELHQTFVWNLKQIGLKAFEWNRFYFFPFVFLHFCTPYFSLINQDLGEKIVNSRRDAALTVFLNLTCKTDVANSSLMQLQQIRIIWLEINLVRINLKMTPELLQINFYNSLQYTVNLMSLKQTLSHMILCWHSSHHEMSLTKGLCRLCYIDRCIGTYEYLKNL